MAPVGWLVGRKDMHGVEREEMEKHTHSAAEATFFFFSMQNTVINDYHTKMQHNQLLIPT